MEISQKLTNSVPITPGPNINKPRIPRPQDTAYQEIMIAKEKSKEEGEPTSVLSWAWYYPRNTVIPYVIPKKTRLCQQHATFFWLVEI
jgi:hypothetical protein